MTGREVIGSDREGGDRERGGKGGWPAGTPCVVEGYGSTYYYGSTVVLWLYCTTMALLYDYGSSTPHRAEDVYIVSTL